MADIEKQRANRLLVMKAIYDASDGSEGNPVSGPALLENLGLSDQELGDACRYLEGEHLIRGTKTLWSHLTPYIINITHRGIKEMEESLQAPSKPTAHFPPAISIVNVQGNLIGSSIQSGSPGARQRMTMKDINIEPTTEETLPSKPERTYPWRLILMVTIAGVGAAVTGLLGAARLDWLSLAIVVAAAGATLAAVTYAITEEKYRTWALGISTCICTALLLWIGISDLIGAPPARTANVVANEEVYESAEAGVSPTKEPVYDVNGNREHFDKGSVQTATCYSVIGSSIWLYFHFSPGDAGWAPVNEFHYQNGFAKQLPSHCP